MHIRYKYYRDMHSRPLVTVCIIEHNGRKTSGMAICSPLDNPNKTTGRNIAFNRAYLALLHPELTPTLPVIRHEALGVLAKCTGDVNVWYKQINKAVERRDSALIK